MPKRKQGERGIARQVSAVLCLCTALFVAAFPFAFLPRASARNDTAAFVSTSTREGRLAVFDDAWTRINERYYDETFHGVDWEAQRVNFRALAANTETSDELYAVLRRMIAPLNDPHTRVFAPEEKYDWWRPRFITVGLSLSEIDGAPTVVSVEPDSAPSRAGVRAGDVIETVDGEAALVRLQERLGAANSADSSVRFRAFAKLLDGPAETSVQVGWKTKDGKHKSAGFVRYWQQRELGIRFHREGDITVVQIDAFTKPLATAFARALKEKLSGSRGVILDLRGNGGGDAEAMSDIASSFLGIGISLGYFTDRVGMSFTISTHSKSLLTPDRIVQTKLPLIVLTSARTASAAEILVEALKRSGRARVMGTETCGCVLAVRTRHLLPDGGLLDVSELDYETAAGERLEKHGIKPDDTVVVERNDLYSKRDRAIQFAVNRLSRSSQHTQLLSVSN